MQKKILISFLFLFLGVSLMHAQTEERPANGPKGVKNVRDELNRKQGVWSTYNTNGDLLKREEYVNDKKEGLTTIYFSGGGPEPEKIREETYYFAGKKDSISTKKYLSQQTSVEGTFDMGKKHGKWTTYYEDGQIKAEGSFIKGNRDGEWKWYNRKGVLIRKTIYSNGVDAGTAKPAAKGDKDKGKGGKATPTPAGGVKK
jgi:antitoxin component YwqK of YwqJK toxin-antitoxin module